MMQALFLLGLGLFCMICVWCAVHALQFLTVDRAIAARIGRLRLSVLCFGLGVGAAMADGVLLPMHLSDFGLGLGDTINGILVSFSDVNIPDGQTGADIAERAHQGEIRM